MELVLGLWILYALGLVGWVPGRGVLFFRPLLGWRAVHGPGWRWAPPLPSAPALRSEPFVLREKTEGLLADTAPSWRADRGGAARGRAFARKDLADARAHGRTVSIGRHPIAVAIDEAAAARLAGRLRAAAAANDAEAAEPLAEAIREGLCAETLRARLARARRATRAFAWAADTYGVVLGLALPVVVTTIGAEAGLRAAAPVLGALHVTTLLALGVAHARLGTGRRGERAEMLLSAALYPPGLLRAGSGLFARTVGTFHPATMAAVLLRGERRERLLRAELVRARRAAEAPGALGLARVELEALRALLAAEGVSETELLAPPERADALARSYCPACGWEYRAPAGPCNDCGGARVAYGS